MSAPDKPTRARMRAPDDQPNINDYAKILIDPDDPDKLIWQVYAGNHQVTHRSQGNYVRLWNAERALAREHPDVPLRED